MRRLFLIQGSIITGCCWCGNFLPGRRKGWHSIGWRLISHLHMRANWKTIFLYEESFLAPKLPNGHPLLLRLLEEHVLLRELVVKINHDPYDLGLQTSFADGLEKHIRFEEGESFLFIQEHLNELQLKELVAVERNAPVCNLDD
jgi:hypothetical protein